MTLSSVIAVLRLIGVPRRRRCEQRHVKYSPECAYVSCRGTGIFFSTKNSFRCVHAFAYRFSVFGLYEKFCSSHDSTHSRQASWTSATRPALPSLSRASAQSSALRVAAGESFLKVEENLLLASVRS